MIFARSLWPDAVRDFEPALRRLGLPTPARAYVQEKLPPVTVLLSGIAREHGRFLKALEQRSVAPGHEVFPSYLPGNVDKRPGTALLTGRKDQFDRLLKACREAPPEDGLQAMGTALRRALEAGTGLSPLLLGPRRFEWGARTYVMAVLNVTPDSFSDGGRYQRADLAVAHGVSLALAGADVLDVGGASTRPGAAEVPENEELERVLPVVARLRRETDVPISVDTRSPGVADAVLAAGAQMINDVSGLAGSGGSGEGEGGRELAQVVSRAGAALCLMHMQGTPQNMQHSPRYGDVMEEVAEFLEGAVMRAEASGVPRSRVLIDPGIGFGKMFSHNLFLMRHLAELRALGQAVVIGTSRKAFLGALAGNKPADHRLSATLASVAALAAGGGADMVRVHDVAEVKDALAVADAMRHAEDGGELYGAGLPSRSLNP